MIISSQVCRNVSQTIKLLKQQIRKRWYLESFVMYKSRVNDILIFEGMRKQINLFR